MVDTYLPDCGLKGIDEALRQAETAETKLSGEERTVLGFSYYSPYFLNEAELQKVKFLTAVFFLCAEKRMRIERDYREELKVARYHAQSRR